MIDLNSMETDYEQFRMSRLQVFNWGTFSGWHDIKISTRGFLFVGGSGSGKSTLLDAIAALLVPPRWIDFNAAARETDRSGRDRNLVSYIRGAIAEQKDSESGMYSTQYLRGESTWSAISLSFQNGRGRTITLLQVFYLRGTTSDVHRSFFILERSLELSELDGFDFDIRKLKAKLGDATHRTEFSSYCERFRRMLNIDNEMALRLLHKTQSAKNLGDLNTFLREFMLDKPETFDAAQRLVQEFGELNAAHQSVLTARQQVEVLTPARENFEKHEDEGRQCLKLESLKLKIDLFGERKRRDLLKDVLKDLNVKRDAVLSETIECEERHVHQQQELDDLQIRHRELGGEQIEQWEKQLLELEQIKSQRISKLEQVDDACKVLRWNRPESHEELAQTVSDARDLLANQPRHDEQIRKAFVDLSVQKSNIQESLRKTQDEIDGLLKQSSNIPNEMLRIRREIAQALSLHESVLPFAGELIDVIDRDRSWQGALERTLHNFAVSMLVEERHSIAVTKYVNETNLRGKLRLSKMVKVEHALKSAPVFNSLHSKLHLKPGVHFSWLDAELKNRFNYECVSSEQNLRKVDRGITIEGLIRHSKSRFEKDDRKGMNDRKNWVLGWDNREKLEAFKAEAQKLDASIASLSEQLDALSEQTDRSRLNSLKCQSLSQIQWSEIDVKSILHRINHIEVQLKETRDKNTDLNRLADQISKQKQKLEKTENKLRDFGADLKIVDRDISKRDGQLKQTEASIEGTRLEDVDEVELSKRFEFDRGDITVDNLDKNLRDLERGIGNEITESRSTMFGYAQKIQEAFSKFKSLWKAESANMDVSLESASDYLALLTRLETDGLPSFEQRFFDMLQTQSHQNLTALNSHIKQGRKLIHDAWKL